MSGKEAVVAFDVADDGLRVARYCRLAADAEEESGAALSGTIAWLRQAADVLERHAVEVPLLERALGALDTLWACLDTTAETQEGHVLIRGGLGPEVVAQVRAVLVEAGRNTP